MANTLLQSNLVPVALSVDGGTTYKNVVCKKAWKFTGDTPITNEDTDCGRLIGLGVFSATITMELVMNTTPSGTEVSAEDMLAYVVNQQLLALRIAYPGPAVGTDIYIQGNGYLTKFDIDNKVGSLMVASATFSFTGIVDNTP